MAIDPRIQGTLVNIKHLEGSPVVGEGIQVCNHLVFALAPAVEQQIRVAVDVEVPEVNILL